MSARPRRWRLYAVIAIVVITLGFVAWHRLGRIDPRLIGRWGNIDPNGFPAECIFTSDGRSSWIVGYVSVPITTGYGWCARGDELVLANQQPFRLRPTLASIRVNLALLIGRFKDDGVVERLKILEVTDTTLKLKRKKPWGSSPDGVEVYVRQRDE